MQVSVIIVNWNSKTYVRQCLRSLYEHCRSLPWEVIVVDGGSYDGCDEMVAAEFPSVIFIQSPENVGFARANNLGEKSASGRYLLFLNPDTRVSEDSIRILVEALQSLPEAVAVGCRLLNADGTLQTSCVQKFPTVANQVFDSEFLRERFPDWELWGMQSLHAPWQQPATVEVISGACILADRQAFRQVGGFTESYFMYGEDLDLCYKLRRSGGRVYYVPSTSIVHFGGGSTAQAASNFSNVMMRESVRLFMRRNYGQAPAIAYRFSMMVTALARLLAMGPMMIWGNSVVRHGTGSWRKWRAIFGWSIGMAPTAPGQRSASAQFAMAESASNKHGV